MIKRKMISIKAEQERWIIEKNINLSRFVQRKIDEEIKIMEV